MRLCQLIDAKALGIQNPILILLIWILNIFITPFLLAGNSIYIYFLPCFSITILSLLSTLTKSICKCCMSCLLYTDSKFPPSQNSVGKVEANIQITWKRASELKFDSKPVDRLFHGISPSDLGQGQLGDCWLLAAFATLCEQPYRIQNLFITSVFNPFGKYKIRLFDPKTKKWVTMTIDDFIPCDEKGEPLFTQLRDNELWPLLLEKAFAKMYGSYSAIEGGSPLNALKSMTGFVGSSYDLSKADDKLFKSFQKFQRDGCLLAAGSKGQDNTRTDGRESVSSSIVGGHAYSILDIRTPTFTTSTIRLLKLRNPWGTKVWTGDWSDSSSLWTTHPGVAVQIGKGKAEDGVFYIEWKDFCANFSHVDVLFTGSDIHHLHLTVYEGLGLCGPCGGMFTGCGNFWCLCQGVCRLWFPKSSEDLQSEEQASPKYCCFCCPCSASSVAPLPA